MEIKMTRRGGGGVGEGVERRLTCGELLCARGEGQAWGEGRVEREMGGQAVAYFG